MVKKSSCLIIGVLVGLLLAGSLAFAQPLNEYILKQATYPIIVNGQKYENDELPILNYNGVTYIPLKEVGNLLGANVKWDAKQNQILINTGGNDNMQTNITENIVKTTYKELQAIEVDGEIYFQAVDFNRKFAIKGENMELQYNNQNKLTTLVNSITGSIISEIPIESIKIYNGHTYIHSYFYPNTATNDVSIR